MKTCPYCAEEIQDGAVLCKHCGRNVPGGDTTAQGFGQLGSKKVSIRGVVGGVVLGLLLIYAFLLVLRGQQARTLLEQQRILVHNPPPPPAYTVRISDGAPVEIQTGQYHDWSFVLPNRSCTLMGHVEGISGGNKDFEGFILSDDDFKNWSTSHQAHAVQSGRVAAWTPSVPLFGPGTYHLVVSNLFSVFSVKVVTVTGTVVCP